MVRYRRGAFYRNRVLFAREYGRQDGPAGRRPRDNGNNYNIIYVYKEEFTAAETDCHSTAIFLHNAIRRGAAVATRNVAAA